MSTAVNQLAKARLMTILGLLFLNVAVTTVRAEGLFAPETTAREKTAADERSGSADTPTGNAPNKDDKGGAVASDAAGGSEPIDRLRALEDAVRSQNLRIEEMRKLIDDQQRTIRLLAGGSSEATQTKSPPPQVVVASNQSPAAAKDQTQPGEPQKKLDELYKRFGAIRFSGDLRFRLETFDNQGFDAMLEPPGRRRLRLRARLALDGAINKNFDWGFRLASGLFTDPVSTNQTLTDFYERKPFALERAFVRYDSKTDKVGVQLIAGKFEPTFRRTQMVWDDDVNVEGASEAIYFKTKSALRQIKLVAFELPFNEAAVGKDGILYGGQAQTDWQFSSHVSANVNVAYYDWNRPDQVVIGLGLGALATQVNGGIFNGSGVTGGQNGLLGTTNRIIRNAAGVPTGFQAGFNLLDILSNLNWQVQKYPVTFTFDYVHNLTGRVSDEKDGYWVGGQFGQTKEKGEWLAGYYFTRIEQDAVLVPFNFSDILGSNSRVHMPTFAYQVAGGVTLQWTGLFSQRVNKVVPLSPFNRYLSRMQFDVIYKF
ncbi:MAG TPA: putative porin [Blastocatellia bacterium]|nr:putative porin [Blastocatellia bacterium]